MSASPSAPSRRSASRIRHSSSRASRLAARRDPARERDRQRVDHPHTSTPRPSDPLSPFDGLRETREGPSTAARSPPKRCAATRQPRLDAIRLTAPLLPSAVQPIRSRTPRNGRSTSATQSSPERRTTHRRRMLGVGAIGITSVKKVASLAASRLNTTTGA